VEKPFGWFQAAPNNCSSIAKYKNVSARSSALLFWLQPTDDLTEKHKPKIKIEET